MMHSRTNHDGDENEEYEMPRAVYASKRCSGKILTFIIEERRHRLNRLVIYDFPWRVASTEEDAHKSIYTGNTRWGWGSRALRGLGEEHKQKL